MKRASFCVAAIASAMAVTHLAAPAQAQSRSLNAIQNNNPLFSSHGGLGQRMQARPATLNGLNGPAGLPQLNGGQNPNVQMNPGMLGSLGNEGNGVLNQIQQPGNPGRPQGPIVQNPNDNIDLQQLLGPSQVNSTPNEVIEGNPAPPAPPVAQVAPGAPVAPLAAEAQPVAPPVAGGDAVVAPVETAVAAAPVAAVVAPVCEWHQPGHMLNFHYNWFRLHAPAHCLWWFDHCEALRWSMPGMYRIAIWQYCPHMVVVDGLPIFSQKIWYLGLRGMILPGVGIGVDGLVPNSPAALSGLQPGMVILSANGIKIQDELDLHEAIVRSNGILDVEILPAIGAPVQMMQIQLLAVPPVAF